MIFHIFQQHSPDGDYVDLHNDEGAFLCSVRTADRARTLVQEMSLPAMRCWRDPSKIPPIEFAEHPDGITVADVFSIPVRSPPRHDQLDIFGEAA